MIEKLAEQVVQQFILANEHASAADLLLKYREIQGVPAALVVNQIVGRKKAADKIPLYYTTPGILYPPVKNLEQSSSQRTAQFKADLLSQLEITGAWLDLTGGFGIDSYFISRVCSQVTMVEPDEELLSVAKYNHDLLGANNIQHINTSAETFLSSTQDSYAAVFIDPSRRIEGNKKVYSLKKSEPDIVGLRDTIFQRAGYLLLKASPLLDVQHALNDLSLVSKVIVVSVDNECKELLFLMSPEQNKDPLIEAINLHKNGTSRFQITFSEERAALIQFAPPGRYLYEPNASVLKAGGFKMIALKYALFKLHADTHLYTSEKIMDDFPGKIFEITGHVKPDPKSVRQFLDDQKANIMVRNYPLDPAELKKKTKLKDGGDKFLIGFTGVDKKYLVTAIRVN